MSKHVSKTLEWDQVFYQMSAQRKVLFLMFGRDPIVPMNSLLMPTVRYLGTDENMLSLEALKNIYKLIARNLEQA